MVSLLEHIIGTCSLRLSKAYTKTLLLYINNIKIAFLIIENFIIQRKCGTLHYQPFIQIMILNAIDIKVGNELDINVAILTHSLFILNLINYYNTVI